jgi:hypothetical protein
MTGLNVGEKVNVRCEDGLKYVLVVEVTAICSDNEFIGRVERVFADRSQEPGGGEIMKGSHVLAVIGQEKTFKNEDIVPAAY